MSLDDQTLHVILCIAKACEHPYLGDAHASRRPNHWKNSKLASLRSTYHKKPDERLKLQQARSIRCRKTMHRRKPTKTLNSPLSRATANVSRNSAQKGRLQNRDGTNQRPVIPADSVPNLFLKIFQGFFPPAIEGRQHLAEISECDGNFCSKHSRADGDLKLNTEE